MAGAQSGAATVPGYRVTRALLQSLATTRIAEARILLDAGHYAGAYYLAGYSIECAFKACIAGSIQAGEFPDKALASQVTIHDLTKLRGFSGLDQELTDAQKANPRLDANWGTVKDWTEAVRYSLHADARLAQDMCDACDGLDGVLTWVMQRW